MMLQTGITIGIVRVHNRLVMPPLATEKSTPEGFVTDALIQHYERRARGGYIGLMITEHTFIEPLSKASPCQLSLATDAVIPGLTKLVEAIHNVGATKVFAQINHAGAAADCKSIGTTPVGPSSLMIGNHWKGNLPMPRALTVDEIKALVQQYVAAARRAQEAGYDGVEIHSAHGYLLDQFYSPLTNQRTDDYGGSLENRIRFHREVIAAVRDAVGADYPVAIRLGGCDYLPGGATIDDAVAACRQFVQDGVNLLDISGGIAGYIRPDKVKYPGYFKDVSKAVKEAVSVPVILTGGVTTGAEAEALLQEGAADLIGVGRKLLQDSLWAQKIKE